MNTIGDFLQVLVAVFVPLFPVVNPIGCAPIFLSIAERYPNATQRILSGKIAVYSFVLLSVSFLFGSIILNFFGISLAVMQIAGGMVLGATGWNLLNQKDDDSTASKAPTTLDDAMQHAFFPLTLPITVGPGVISIAITLGAHLRHQAGPGWENGFPRHMIAGLVAMFLLSVLVVVCYANANRIVRMLGKSGAAILVRLSAFILFAIGVQIFWNGLGAGIPQIMSALTTHSQP